jgi:hypothetical protein
MEEYFNVKIFGSVLKFVLEEAELHGETPERFIARMVWYESQKHPKRCTVRLGRPQRPRRKPEGAET